MIRSDINDTIAAISSAVGSCGIGIVRVSGQKALSIAGRIFRSKDGRKAEEFKTYTVHYGWIAEEPGGNIIDEVILTVMRSPRTYTREDVVEINCHGGIVALRRVLDLALENGARLAEPGEFTRRAFLSGRIDLAQAEAVLDVIQAKTDDALKISQEQLGGVVSGRINKLSKALLGILAALEANIDFPEDQIASPDMRSLGQGLRGIDKELKGILESSRHGRIIREGIHAVICGRPNVGKSSLLNALLKQERSIVTHIAGTTRDTIEEIIDIKGIPVRIVDTAGIIEPRDLVEKKALERSRKHIAAADLVIFVFDGTNRLNSDDQTLARKLSKKTVIAVINKIDMKQRIAKDRIPARFSSVVEISAKKLKNIDKLEEAIVDAVSKGRVKSPEPGLVSNLRHIEALRKAEKLVEEALISLDNRLSAEFIAQDIKDALGYLDDILGQRFSQGLLDEIFSRFCIGK